MKKFLSSFFVFSLCILGIIPVSAQGLTYPSSFPTGQIDGGYFNMYFKNMLGTCPPGKVLAGFYYNPANKKDTTNGTPFCVSVDGGASYLTGALRGQDGRIPMWSSGGTLLTGSVLFQNNGNIAIGHTTPQAKLDVSGQMRIADGTAGTGYVLKSVDGSGKASWSATWPLPCIPGGTGAWNVCYGANALAMNTTWNSSVAIGFNALNKNTAWVYNTAIWYYSLFSNTTGNSNTANGLQALYSNTIGSSNTANGVSALYSNTTGNSNTANGVNALYSNTTGNSNTANGVNALYSNTTGNSNTAIGEQSMRNNTTASYNVAMGMYSLFSNTTGSSNTANGVGALFSNSWGANHTAMWYQAAYNIVSYGGGQPNVAIGGYALYGGDSTTPANNTAYDNVAIGYQAMYGTPGSGSTGYSNVAVWNGALRSNTTGYNNTAIGRSALFANTSGLYNTANGYQALSSNTTGWDNTANGFYALLENQIGNSNTAIGSSSLRRSKGSANTANGNNSLEGLQNGIYNAWFGFYAWSNLLSWNNNIAIGTNTNFPSSTGSNQLNIGNTIYGTNIGQATANIGIGTTTPSEKLEVAGNIKATAFFYTSDRRLKTDMTPLTSAREKLAQLTGYRFVWKDSQKKDIGVIAQEVEKVFPEIVHTDPKTGMKAVEYGNLVAPIIEAIKELSRIADLHAEQIQEQNKAIESLKKENQDLRNRLEKIEKQLQK